MCVVVQWPQEERRVIFMGIEVWMEKWTWTLQWLLTMQ